MKKNKAMRLAAILLVVVLVTTCAISGSFAKYVSEGSGYDSARVAKFGVSVEMTSDADFFHAEYKATETNQSTYGITYAVKSNDDTKGEDDGAKVVAPGTSGNILSATVSGTSEVSVLLEFKNAELTLSGWEVEDENGDTVYYCPIIITVGDTSYCGLDYDSASDFQKAIDAAIDDDLSEPYEAGTNMTEANDAMDSVTWSWAFDADSEGAPAGQNDNYDTQLGNAESPASIALTVAVDVTQID